MAAKNTNQSSKLLIHLDLLRSQSDYSKLSSKIIHYLVSTGKYILITVEAIMLIAFFIRFKLDTDLATQQKAINQKKDYIQSLRVSEIAIRQTQFKLSQVKLFYENYVEYPQIFKEIADQTPPGVKFINVAMETQENKVIIRINAQAQSSNDISNFTQGLKTSQHFKDVGLTTLNVEQNIIKFTLNLSAPIKLES
ncbi:hypothetical protein A3B45_02320 [Candidatus Daviesbacteria bacterium RIFCSPLOWO2_01_FULL_39_12]|uniref:PilN biogenesis protein dimerization domain-containing protein n=1 Tax=Candidatus Daviesbacteria bacterium RIFCSPLOWO2_01_FULL_39_12 TaxID=1797785 RepID=A0A1F5KSF0_9BACT|nr:MAG: hypothetical protein A3D79_00730 [Candidatus Daviesbacteria bacterium RIFCSPHIGHO2_02_FULL_39_8]OGE43842.1 MAG: hypothetical protein A3B45_02320 [Candidatus Daviesbacteria bacterium RIFCSPLOWO2_01_FULL_39_12]